MSPKRRAMVESVMVGALVSVLVRLAWVQAKDLDDALAIWPARGDSNR